MNYLSSLIGSSIAIVIIVFYLTDQHQKELNQCVRSLDNVIQYYENSND